MFIGVVIVLFTCTTIIHCLLLFSLLAFFMGIILRSISYVGFSSNPEHEALNHAIEWGVVFSDPPNGASIGNVEPRFENFG
jgi:uncharacterized membrane protein